MSKTLFDKVWDSHVVRKIEDGPDVFFIDRHFIHEVTSPVAFLGLKEREPVTIEWLQKKGTDSIRLWRKKGDYTTINIDFAPIGSFEAFMRDEPIPEEGE